jgi:amidase
MVSAAYAGREEEAGPIARAILKRAEREAPPALDAFMDAWDERDRLRASLLKWMETRPVVVAPVGALAAFGHEEGRRLTVGGKELGLFNAFGYAQAFNVFDLPVACVPAGRTKEGLPAGVQIVGRPFEEWRVLRAARVVEAALGGSVSAP